MSQKIKILQETIQRLSIYSLGSIKVLVSEEKMLIHFHMLKLCSAMAAILDFQSTINKYNLLWGT